MIYTQQKADVYMYPFANEGEALELAANRLIIRDNRVILDFDRVSLSPEMAKKLAKVLLHAADACTRSEAASEMAEKGRE